MNKLPDDCSRLIYKFIFDDVVKQLNTITISIINHFVYKFSYDDYMYKYSHKDSDVEYFRWDNHIFYNAKKYYTKYYKNTKIRFYYTHQFGKLNHNEVKLIKKHTISKNLFYQDQSFQQNV